MSASTIAGRVTHDRATEFGGFAGYRIRMGGQIRFSFPFNTSSGEFHEGCVLELNSDGTVQLDTSATNGKLKGLSDERFLGTDSTFEDLMRGSGKASMLLDPAIVETTCLNSGVAFLVNDLVYTDGTGELTNAAAGPILGIALSNAVANAGDTLVFYYNNRLKA